MKEIPSNLNVLTRSDGFRGTKEVEEEEWNGAFQDGKIFAGDGGGEVTGRVCKNEGLRARSICT